MKKNAKYSSYWFDIGSEFHSTIDHIDAYTKTEAYMEARRLRISPNDKCNLVSEEVLWRAK